jgi:SagB-type dehydrogenase family enzyme
LSFDLSVYDIFGLLAAGGAIVLPDAGGMRDPAHWATMVARHQVTIWNTVPALMDLLTDYAEQQAEPILQSLRTVMMSGDWVPVKLPDRIRALGNIDVYSLGGATEASIWSIIYPIGEVPQDWISIPYGKPMLNQSFHVLNSDLAPCPDWVPGELFIGGIGVAMGYWHDDEKTAASFITHPRTGERLYRTGDLGRYLPDGNIEFMGREDFQVKIQGFRVELGDIEAALESHTSIRNAVVVAMGPDRGNKRLVGYVVPEGTAASADELKSWLANKLPEYMVPGAFVVLDKLPLTANGKVARNELPEPPSLESGGQTPSTAVSAADSSEVARIVEEILNADKLEAGANLLQLGATSIEMIRIANALDQHLGFRPRMDEFYREPSIAGLSTLLAKQQPQSVAADYPSGGDPLLTPAWLLDGIPKIMDPDERNQFKKSRPGLRQFESSADRLKLGALESDETAYLQHRSYRDFSKAPLAIEVLGELLGQLSSIHLHSSPKYLYASAGGMYPVQCYLYIKPERVNGVAAGYYYHDPESNSLVRTAAQDDELRQLYDPIFNRPIFDQAAFAIFLVADLEAIGAMYQERALHYSVLETGHITQILETRAPTIGLGLCQTGGIETADLQKQLALGEHHLVLHGLLGGGLPDPKTTSNPITDSTTTDERDEGEL